MLFSYLTFFLCWMMRVRRIEDFKRHSNKGRTLLIAIKVRDVSGSGNTPRSMKHWTEKLLPWIGGLKK